MPTEPRVLPKRFLRPCVLLLLREQASHGYELLERLAPFGFTRSDPGGLYRTLRTLEEEGLVHSAWEPSTEGPDRRIYELTRAGTEELHRWAGALDGARSTLDVFLARYGEFVSIEPSGERRRGRRSRVS